MPAQKHLRVAAQKSIRLRLQHQFLDRSACKAFMIGAAAREGAFRDFDCDVIHAVSLPCT